jgi:hypothetical protein
LIVVWLEVLVEVAILVVAMLVAELMHLLGTGSKLVWTAIVSTHLH